MPTSGLLDTGSDPFQLRATMDLAANLAQGQCLRLLPCAEAAMLRVQPHVAELLLRHGQLRSGGQSEEYDSSWSSFRNKTPPDFFNQNCFRV